ncbi:hypothetical protein [Adhaeribacter pallidiroseus]|uniref:Uncharacterized protein n=1 Tax=Adhaeribacter pallidiroseus TaxID=2072847 RepID=A0A369QMX7_9BACT|nr:hypothetical protein [Adhaeribacter pallidiroseus]RDC64617.1 hypothetical protein AHMF7616_03233 [Adhaeribacter pallidiroseus]
MGVEYRNGKPYLYKKVRKNGKVISEYVCGGALIWALVDLQEYDQLKNNEIKEATRKEKDLQLQADREIYMLEKSLKEIMNQVAVANGYHKLNGQWRRKRQKQRRVKPDSTNY